MAHLNEFCSKDCGFNADNQVEYENACKFCYVMEIARVSPPVAVIAFGEEVLMVGRSPKWTYIKKQMSNGKWSNSAVHNSQVKRK